MKLLVVEDEHRVATAIKEGLEQESYAVDIEHDGGDGLRAALVGEYDLIILDIMLPTMSGLEVCRQLRAAKIHTPILMLTANGQDKDVVSGLNNGADDYLIKPFSFEVLIARIRALLRRPQESLENVLQVNELTLNTVTKQVQRGGENIKLTVKEFAILEYMMRNPGRILSKHNIITHVWDFDADILQNNLEVFIVYIRAKIDKPFKAPPLLQTVRGFGYVIGSKNGL